MLSRSLLSVTGNLESRKAKGFARVGHFNIGMVVFVLVLVTIAVIRHMTINNLGRKGFLSAYSSIMVQKLYYGRNLEEGALKGCCLLAYSLWLTWLVLFHNPGPPVPGRHHPQ